MFIVLSLSDDGQSVICRIYDKHYRRMLYTASQILGASRAEDAVHDIFVKLIEKYGEEIVKMGDNPGQFFVIVVRNHSIDLLKKEKAVYQISYEDNEDEDIFTEASPSPESIVEEKESADRLVSLIRRMKPAARQLLEYKYIIEYSNKEIANMLGISQTAVSTRIGKAKKRLREMLDGEEALDNANE